MRSVTTIVPVYKDIETLGACVDSLIKFTRPQDTVIFINDRSDQWEEVEKLICSKINGIENFKYYLNPQNMGFVKTCNRGVFELDKTDNDIFLLNSDTRITEGAVQELSEILYLAEKHGVVCPRSNNATILTVPIKNELGRNVTEEESISVYTQVKDLLPRYQVLPTGVGFAMLVKRSLIKNYGLFDEIYSPGYNEENDFCMRINEYGYNAIMANRAYVFHAGSKNFNEKSSDLDQLHLATLLKRYPYYWDSVRLYENYEMDAVNYFADMIAEGIYPRKRILISLYGLSAAYDGTSRHGIRFTEEFLKIFSEKYDISILVNNSAEEFFDLKNRFENVYLPEEMSERYHLAFVPSQIIHPEHLHILNRHALRFVFDMQDIISIRSRYLLCTDWEREEIFRKSIKYCAGMVAISDFSLEDTKNYYLQTISDRDIPMRSIYLGCDKESGEKHLGHKSIKLPFDDYYLIFGNKYKHKSIEPTKKALESVSFNFIVVGSSVTGKYSDNIYEYESGNLSDELIDQLLCKCKAIIFPSVYEGFGLPILDAIKLKKHILVRDNSLNRELINAFDKECVFVHTYSTTDQIADILMSIKDTPQIKSIKLRTWTDVARDVEVFIEEVFDKPIDVKTLGDRWRTIRYEERVHRCYTGYISNVSSLSRMDRFKISVKKIIPGPYLWLRKKYHILKKGKRIGY